MCLEQICHAYSGGDLVLYECDRTKVERMSDRTEAHGDDGEEEG